MIRNLILILTVVFLSGCSHTSSYRMTEPNEVVQDKWIAITVPDNSWKIYKEYKKSKYYNNTGELPDLDKRVPGVRYKFDFRTYSYKKSIFAKQFFNKDAVYGDSDKVKEVYDEIDKEQGINYKKGWQVYIKGMRCAGGVYARVSKGTYAHVDKNYGITCGYYNKREGRRLIDIGYSYIYANGNTRLQKDKGKPREKLLTQKEAETIFKKDLKDIIATLKIKNFDKNKMIEEGLYYPNEEFKSTKW